MKRVKNTAAEALTWQQCREDVTATCHWKAAVTRLRRSCWLQQLTAVAVSQSVPHLAHDWPTSVLRFALVTFHEHALDDRGAAGTADDFSQ